VHGEIHAFVKSQVSGRNGRALVFYPGAYIFSHWQGEVVQIVQIPADSRKEIDARAVFAHVDESKGEWEPHFRTAHLSRSDVRLIYHGDRQLDVDTLNSKETFATLWR
jgi:hypothetical protein